MQNGQLRWDVFKAHQSRTRLCVVEILATDQEKQWDCEWDKHEYINSFPETELLLACTKNQYLWGKDHLAFSSHGGYTICMFKTIIELELMCTVKQEPRFSSCGPTCHKNKLCWCWGKDCSLFMGRGAAFSACACNLFCSLLLPGSIPIKEQWK